MSEEKNAPVQQKNVFPVPAENQERLKKLEFELNTVQRDLGSIELQYAALTAKKEFLLKKHSENREEINYLFRKIAKFEGIDVDKLDISNPWTLDVGTMTFKRDI